MRTLILVSFLAASASWAQEPQFRIGSANPDLYEGARMLLAGRHEEGIRLTLAGLEAATSRKDEEVALSNLCAGYTNMGDYESALRYCDILLTRNDKLWRPYNSLALIYIETKQYDKAEQALIRGEALNPGAQSLKIARALYLDATQPVTEDIVIDDRENKDQRPQ